MNIGETITGVIRAAAMRIQSLADWVLKRLPAPGEPDRSTTGTAPAEDEAEGDLQIDSSGPPAHWVERVRQAAPHLLRPGPTSRAPAPLPVQQRHLRSPEQPLRSPSAEHHAEPPLPRNATAPESFAEPVAGERFAAPPPLDSTDRPTRSAVSAHRSPFGSHTPRALPLMLHVATAEADAASRPEPSPAREPDAVGASSDMSSPDRDVSPHSQPAASCFSGSAAMEAVKPDREPGFSPGKEHEAYLTVGLPHERSEGAESAPVRSPDSPDAWSADVTPITAGGSPPAREWVPLEPHHLHHAPAPSHRVPPDPAMGDRKGADAAEWPHDGEPAPPRRVPEPWQAFDRPGVGAAEPLDSAGFGWSGVSAEGSRMGRSNFDTLPMDSGNEDRWPPLPTRHGAVDPFEAVSRVLAEQRRTAEASREQEGSPWSG